MLWQKSCLKNDDWTTYISCLMWSTKEWISKFYFMLICWLFSFGCDLLVPAFSSHIYFVVFQARCRYFDWFSIPIIEIIFRCICSIISTKIISITWTCVECNIDKYYWLLCRISQITMQWIIQLFIHMYIMCVVCAMHVCELSKHSFNFHIINKKHQQKCYCINQAKTLAITEKFCISHFNKSISPSIFIIHQANSNELSQPIGVAYFW